MFRVCRSDDLIFAKQDALEQAVSSRTIARMPCLSSVCDEATGRLVERLSAYDRLQRDAQREASARCREQATEAPLGACRAEALTAGESRNGLGGIPCPDTCKLLTSREVLHFGFRTAAEVQTLVALHPGASLSDSGTVSH